MLRFQVLHTFRGLRSRCQARLSLVPLSGLTFQRCCAKLCLAIHFMLRAAVLHPFLWGIQCLPGLTARTGSTAGPPAALVACYVACWRLPRPDFHRLAVDRSRTRHALVMRRLNDSATLTNKFFARRQKNNVHSWKLRFVLLPSHHIKCTLFCDKEDLLISIR